jgi:hypothetical protein
MSGKKTHKSRKQFRGCLALDDRSANPIIRKSRRVKTWMHQPLPPRGKVRRGRVCGLPLVPAPVVRKGRKAKYVWPIPFKGKAKRKRKTGLDPATGPAPLPRRRPRRMPAADLFNAPPRKARRFKTRGGQIGPPPASGLGRKILLAASAGTRLNLTASARAKLVLAAEARTTFYLGAGVSVQANIPFFQGEDLTLYFTLTPLTDVTGWTIVSTLKDKLGGTVQFNPAITITDAGRGKFQAVWTRAQTGALAVGDYVWDVRRTDAGNNTVLAHGEATCRQPVTP